MTTEMVSDEAQLPLPVKEEIEIAQPGITVQIIASRNMDDKILWVHNLPEKKGPIVPMYGKKRKPEGWGNAGGGMEMGRRGEKDELVLLAERYKDAATTPEERRTIEWILESGFNHDQQMILSCGFREFVDETGYFDITILPVGGRLSVHEHMYDNGHRVVTLRARVNNLVKKPIREVEEVDIAEWIDPTEPLPHFLWGRHGLPYYAHDLRTILGSVQYDRHLVREGEILPSTLSISTRFDTSWRWVFPVRGDDRFPQKGFRMEPATWYAFMRYLVDNRVEILNSHTVREHGKKMGFADLLYRRHKNEIDFKSEREKAQTNEGEDDVPENKPFEESVDSARHVLTARMLDEDNNLWRDWMERGLREEGQLK